MHIIPNGYIGGVLWYAFHKSARMLAKQTTLPLTQLTLYPQSSKMRKLPIIHANVDLPVSGFANVFFMQNPYKIQVRAGFRALNSNYAAQCRV